MLVVPITCAVLVQTKFSRGFLLLHSSGFTTKRQTWINIMSVFVNGLYLRGPGIPTQDKNAVLKVKSMS